MFRARLDSSRSDDAGWTTPPAEAMRVLRCDSVATGVMLIEAGQPVRRWDDPLAALAWLDDERRQHADRRWVGFLGYELGRLFEPKAGVREQPTPTPTPLFAFGELPFSSQATLPRNAGSDTREPGHNSLREQRPAMRSNVPWEKSSFTREDYLAAVRRCVEYIAAGDVFQINLSQRLELLFAATAADLYDTLLARSPAEYGGLIDLGDLAVVSNSPELFLHVSPEGRVTTRPIKGTRPRGPGMRAELLASEKDAAELNMIVDLERNDLGRVCEVGTVRVVQPRTIEVHPTVYHGVATVEGQLRPDVGLVELLAATFPSGSVTGAPKIRAMQIIDELEPVGRGVYCGAVGYLDADGSAQFNVAIRTATLAENRLYVPVGGGIVADSDPVAEYEETLVKARALLAAAQQAVTGAHRSHIMAASADLGQVS